MRRLAVIFFALAAAFAVPGGAFADHDPPGGFIPIPGEERVRNQGGEGAEFELVESLFTANPLTDIDFFQQNGVTYVSAGTLGAGPNKAGQSIVKLTDGKGEVSKETIAFVSGHASATCVTDATQATGLQHDVEATPKGRFTNATDTVREKGDTQLLLDASDNPGRCHDQGLLGLAGVPQGGLEIIDITDIDSPVEIGLTSHIGESHTVNVDPRRPHIAYSVTSDAVTISKDANGELIRENEIEGDNDANDLDGFEVVDLSSCLEKPAGTLPKNATTEQKRESCRPEVYRYRYPSLEIGLGHTRKTGTQGLFGCHELEIYPNDLLTCGGGNAAILFDMSNAFTALGKPRGTPLPCKVRPSSTADPLFDTEAMVTDCVNGEKNGKAVNLAIPGWKAIGSPSLRGVKHLGSAHHQGRGAAPEDREDGADGDLTSAFDSDEDIDFDHEAELTHSGDFIIATDERGGGVVPPGASCSPGLDNPEGNGGLHAYAVDRLDTELPDSAEEAFKAYAMTPDGKRAIIRADIQTQPQPTFCTAHVIQQVPGQNRIFMGYYTQGTRVFDYQENADGTFEFAEVAFFIPTAANQWVSHVFKADRNKDGSFTYFGVATDIGRTTVDVYKATLPPVGEVFKRNDDRKNENNGNGNNGNGNGSGGGGGVGNVGDGRDAPTLPATGGGMGLIPLGVALLGGAAWVGRSRRNGSEVS